MFCEKCGFYSPQLYSSHISQRPRVIYQDLCHRCFSRKQDALKQVNSAKQKAQKLNLPGTLTWEEWLSTKEHFDFRCVYCGADNAECLDHFIPFVFGGGTEKNNCVPACHKCNSMKKGQHPDNITFVSEKAINWIKSYLSSLD
jgi:5-methylcytosine-specific restriction endonuclease McrA